MSFVSRLSGLASHMGLQMDNKTIGVVGSVCLIANNITGPAMVGIATAFAQAGWLPAIIFIIICGVCSLLASAFLSEAIYAAKDNRGFVRRIELTDILKEHGGMSRPAFLACFWSFILLFISQNIASIVESAQTSDQLLVYYAGKSCALELYPSSGSFRCVSNLNSDSDSPFGSNHWVLSLGFLMTFIVVLPLSFLNLDDNIVIQNLSFIGLVVVLLEWIGQFIFVNGLAKGNPPMVGDLGNRNNLSNLLGPVLFNYAYILTLPSWLNEKKPNVTAMGPATLALAISTVMFIVLGWTAASADYDIFSTSNTDITSTLTGSNSDSPPLTKVAAFIFPPVVLWSGIPVFAIVVRYNLIAEGLCNPLSANMIAAVFPWLLSLILYSGTLLDTLTTWAGLLLVVPLNFILPCLLYIRHRNFDEAAASALLNTNENDPNVTGGGGNMASHLRHHEGSEMSYKSIDISQKEPSDDNDYGLMAQEELQYEDDGEDDGKAYTGNDLGVPLTNNADDDGEFDDEKDGHQAPTLRPLSFASSVSLASSSGRVLRQRQQQLPPVVVDWKFIDLEKHGCDIAKAVVVFSLLLNLAAIIFSV